MSEPFTIGTGAWPGLAKLAEESGELLQVLGKLIAFPEGNHPDGSDLRERLNEEIADVYAALDFFRFNNPIDDEVIARRTAEKIDRFDGWHRGEIRRGERVAWQDALRDERRRPAAAGTCPTCGCVGPWSSEAGVAPEPSEVLAVERIHRWIDEDRDDRYVVIDCPDGPDVRVRFVGEGGGEDTDAVLANAALCAELIEEAGDVQG